MIAELALLHFLVCYWDFFGPVLSHLSHLSITQKTAIRKVRESQNGERKKSVIANLNPQSTSVFYYTPFLLSNMGSNMQQLLIKVHFYISTFELMFAFLWLRYIRYVRFVDLWPSNSLGGGVSVAFISRGNELLVLHFQCYKSSGVGLLSAIKQVSIFLKMLCIPSNHNLSGQRCWKH